MPKKREPFPMLLNYTGKTIYFSTPRNSPWHLSPDINVTILPYFGLAYIENSYVFNPDETWQQVVSEVKGLPPPTYHIAYIVLEDVARAVAAYRTDIVVPTKLRTTKKGFMCEGIGKLYVGGY